MKRKHRSYTRRVAWVPSALCGLALPAAAAPKGHVPHGSKTTPQSGLAAATPSKDLLAWRVRFTPVSLPTASASSKDHASAPLKIEVAPKISLADTPPSTEVSQVMPSYDMQRAARVMRTSSMMRTTAPDSVNRLPVKLAAAVLPQRPVSEPSRAAVSTIVPAVKTVISAKVEPKAPALAQTIPAKPAPVETRLAVAPAKPTAIDERGPADLSARHKDRVLLAQLEANLNRSESSLTRATKDLTEGQKQLAAFGDALRAAMLEAGPDAKGLHPFVRVAQRYAGTPYVWGGESARGFDCSGFIIRVMRDLGYRALPHSAAEQFRYGLPIANALLKPGDLVFFANTYKPGISHVGIYLGRRRFIHAAGTGIGTIVSSLDTPKFRAKYAGARRLVTQ